MGTKQRPRMGSIVTVTSHLERTHHYPTDSWRWTPVNAPPRAGWVVGWRWLLKGRRVFDYDSPTFEETGPRTLAILVVYWPTMNPVHVPIDGWRYGGEPVSPSGTEDQVRMAKEAYARDPEVYPRDEGGRFVEVDYPSAHEDKNESDGGVAHGN